MISQIFEQLALTDLSPRQYELVTKGLKECEDEEKLFIYFCEMYSKIIDREREDKQVKIDVVLDKGAIMPEKAHNTDAGFDLRTPIDCVVKAHNSLCIDTGVRMLIPKGHVGFLKSKSGLNVNYSITSEGVIDSGYTGTIVVKLYNNGDKDKVFECGNKITQIVILPIPDVELKQIEKFEIETERGNNGFGSSGK